MNRSQLADIADTSCELNKLTTKLNKLTTGEPSLSWFGKTFVAIFDGFAKWHDNIVGSYISRHYETKIQQNFRKYSSNGTFVKLAKEGKYDMILLEGDVRYCDELYQAVDDLKKRGVFGDLKVRAYDNCDCKETLLEPYCHVMVSWAR